MVFDVCRKGQGKKKSNRLVSSSSMESNDSDDSDEDQQPKHNSLERCRKKPSKRGHLPKPPAAPPVPSLSLSLPTTPTSSFTPVIGR